MPGWNDHVRKVRESAMLWNRIWVEADCPEAVVLFDLRKQTKKHFCWSITLFWKEVKKIKSHTKQCNSPVVDGFSDDKVISECFRSKLSGILNCSNTTHRNVLLEEVASQIKVSDIEEVDISVELVEHCLEDLGRKYLMAPICYQTILCLLHLSLRHLLQKSSRLSFDIDTFLTQLETVFLFLSRSCL